MQDRPEVFNVTRSVVELQCFRLDAEAGAEVTGSVVAFAKLQGLVGGNASIPGGNVPVASQM